MSLDGTTSDEQTVARQLALGLARHGVEVIFGQSLPSLLVLEAESQGIRQLTYRTENAGGTMADGFARVSNRVGVVTAQNGPAATLLVPPLAEAMKASIPVVALVQDVPASNRERNAFQDFDHIGMFDPCSKWVRRLEDPDRAEDYLDMAFTAALTGRPGPAVLMLPKDLLAERCSPRIPARQASIASFPLDRVWPDPANVARAAALIAEADQPLVIAGGGVHASGAVDAIVELQRVAKVPVATTNMGKGSVDETHPLSLGVIGNVMGPGAPAHHLRDLVRSSDVVLLVGNRTNENGTDSWQLLPPDATFIHLDLDGTEVGRNYESVRLVGDARSGLAALTHALEEHDLSRREQGAEALERIIAEARTRHVNDAAAVTSSDESPLRPERIMRELAACTGPDTIVCGDASYSTIWVSAYLRAERAGQRFLTPRGLAGLGWGLPLALGAQVARPDAHVVCVAGDGGFGHVWSELETAVREELPVTIIVLNNSILGFQKHSELHQFKSHTTATQFGSVDHAALARACGVTGHRVADVAALRDALQDANERRGPTLIDVITSDRAYPPITIWQDSADAILGAD